MHLLFLPVQWRVPQEVREEKQTRGELLPREAGVAGNVMFQFQIPKLTSYNKY